MRKKEAINRFADYTAIRQDGEYKKAVLTIKKPTFAKEIKNRKAKAKEINEAINEFIEKCKEAIKCI